MYGRELTILATSLSPRTNASPSISLERELRTILSSNFYLTGMYSKVNDVDLEVHALLEMVNLGEGLELELDRRVARLQVLEQPAPGISTSTGTRAFPPGPGRRA